MVLERNKYIIRSTTERHGEQKMECVNHQKKGLSCAVHVQVYEIKTCIYSHFFFFFFGNFSELLIFILLKFHKWTKKCHLWATIITEFLSSTWWSCVSLCVKKFNLLHMYVVVDSFGPFQCFKTVQLLSLLLIPRNQFGKKVNHASNKLELAICSGWRVITVCLQCREARGQSVERRYQTVYSHKTYLSLRF